MKWPITTLLNSLRETRAACTPRGIPGLDFLLLHGQFAAGVPRRNTQPTYRFHAVTSMIATPPSRHHVFLRVSTKRSERNFRGLLVDESHASTNDRFSCLFAPCWVKVEPSDTIFTDDWLTRDAFACTAR